MYHPSRGGVRGGSDQFSWDSVKSDKHRENYLGHSVMAPVGRWQKGKDLSWYAKERNKHGSASVEKSKHLSAIKRAEEDAMLVALGLKSAEVETKNLAKEDVASVLKRNMVEHDNKDTERIGGIGIESGHLARLSGNKQNGVIFESFQKSDNKMPEKNYRESMEWKRSKPCKKLKKEKKKKYKEHKHKKKKRRSSSSEILDLDIQKSKKRKKHHSHHT